MKHFDIFGLGIFFKSMIVVCFDFLMIYLERESGECGCESKKSNVDHMVICCDISWQNVDF